MKSFIDKICGGVLYAWTPDVGVSMKHAPSRDLYTYTSHGTFAECDLCGNEGICHEQEGIIACQSCQRELLPVDWAF
jgi:hypothetical protein